MPNENAPQLFIAPGSTSWLKRGSGIREILARRLLPEECQNVIVLSGEFYREISSHPIPTDLEAAKALSASPAALDLFMWLSYRCFTARGQERVPLFGDFGLASQLGSGDYSRPRKFREKLEGWLKLVRAMWPQCPAFIGADGTGLFVDRANAVAPLAGLNARNRPDTGVNSNEDVSTNRLDPFV